MPTPHDILKQVWGYDAFRPLQEDIINAALEGKDTLALLPTGGGKSICFQVPGLVRAGVCIVISPLIALMKDQVEQLKKRGVTAAAIFSGMTGREIDITLDNAVHGAIKFLYVSPERLKTELFIERASRMQVGLLAVDEAHCISQWGYDFRPPYLEIARFRELLPQVNIIALTATATPQVRDDIQDKLAFGENSAFFQKSFARPNLSYSVRHEDNKEAKLLEICQKVPGTAVVYVRNRKRTKELAMWLRKNGVSADYYHAGLSHEERNARQDAWIHDRTRVIVATNAFGMGIDKPDVRLVVHVDLPDTLEAYYQEAGRGGRDEKKAFAVVLYSQADIDGLRRRVTQAFPDITFIKRVYQSLANYYKIAVGSSQMESYDLSLEDFANAYRLPPLEAYHALKKLEEEGFIQLNESFFDPSKVYISTDNKELYKIQVAYAAYDHLIKTLLRMYGGELFTQFMKIDERQLAKAAGEPEGEVVRKLEALHKMEALVYDRRTDKPQVTFITARYDASKLPLDREKLERRRQINLEKMEAVIHYIQHRHRCRTQLLLEYFGEIMYEKCGVCDICVEQKKHPNQKKYDQKYRMKLKQSLGQGPLFPEILLKKVKPENRSRLLDTISYMLEAKELAYDDKGRVVLLN